MFRNLDGDLMILGINGKMGLTLGRLALNAIKAAGVDKQVIGVSRFSDSAGRKKLESWGIKTIACDLIDAEAVSQLPKVRNVIFMAGRKFGTEGQEDLTWAMNTLVPGNVGNHFKDSRIVAFSTGCVYSLMTPESGGSIEEDIPAPIGEYANSCLGRERVFQYCSRQFNTKVLLLRLNYAIDMRYGVLHDIATQIWNNEAVNNTVGTFNILWQGDANSYALESLQLADTPAAVLNITGPETVSVEYVARQLGILMGREVKFSGEPGSSGYLNNAAQAFERFGYPSVSLNEMIKLQAQWIMNDGNSLGKATHFEVNNGSF